MSDFTGWIWPVPTTNGRQPVVSHEFEAGERYKPDGTLNYAVHLGLDLMFPRLPTDPVGPAQYVAASKRYITWPDVRILAAGPGNVWAAGETHLGHFVEVDHGKVNGVGMVTFYQHLSALAQPWKKGDEVSAGTLLGTMGGDPSNVPHLVHLHFEVWLPDGKPQGQWAVDPAPYLRQWAVT